MAFSRLVMSYLYVSQGFEGNETHIISYREKRNARILYIGTIFLSAFLGAAGVVLLYLPHQLFPEFFPWHEFSHPLVGTIKIKWAFSVYGLLLAFVEIALLIILNLLSVSLLARIFGFPEKNHTDKDLHIHTLWDLSFERKPKKMLEIGIDPHQGMSKWTIVTFIVILSLKATLSNIFVKLMLERVLGRFFLMEYIDYVGIPIFASWNIYGTYKVLESAKLRIISTNIIDNFVYNMALKYKTSDVPRYVFKEILQYLAVCKREFDHNHYYLTKKIQDQFELPISKVYCDLNKMIHRIKLLPEHSRKDVLDILILGMVIDGGISKREIAALKIIKNEGLLNYEISMIKDLAKSIRQGKEFKI